MGSTRLFWASGCGWLSWGWHWVRVINCGGLRRRHIFFWHICVSWCSATSTDKSGQETHAWLTFMWATHPRCGVCPQEGQTNTDSGPHAAACMLQRHTGQAVSPSCVGGGPSLVCRSHSRVTGAISPTVWSTRAPTMCACDWRVIPGNCGCGHGAHGRRARRAWCRHAMRTGAYFTYCN